MNKQLRICQPVIKEYEGKARLESLIVANNFQKTYYFEVDEKYAKYLCYERADAFVLGLMYFALVNGYDIECEAPLSEKLYYQLVDAYIPTIVKNDPDLFKPITITSMLDSTPIKNEGAVGASVSGGVDSFYTIIKNLHNETTDYNITHLLLTNCFNIYYDEGSTRERFERICHKGEKIASELNLEFVKVYTNVHEFWYPHFVDLYCLRYNSLPYALQKLFSVYDYSTGYQYKDFTFKAGNRDASHYDFFTVHLISNENLTIYSHGGEASRAEKAKFISSNKVVQENLYVCNRNHDNCCTCEKCMRTQLNLYASGNLKEFGKVFRLELFERNKNRALADIIGRNGDFEKEILDMLRDNGIIIPRIVRIKGYIKYGINCLKKQLKRIKPLVFAVKMLKKNKEDYFSKSERYNMDHNFAIQCDPNII